MLVVLVQVAVLIEAVVLVVPDRSNEMTSLRKVNPGTLLETHLRRIAISVKSYGRKPF